MDKGLGSTQKVSLTMRGVDMRKTRREKQPERQQVGRDLSAAPSGAEGRRCACLPFYSNDSGRNLQVGEELILCILIKPQKNEKKQQMHIFLTLSEKAFLTRT